MANTVAGTHLTGNHASRPAGNAVPDGTLYSCTTHSLVYLSNYAGNSWSTWATLGTVPSGSITASGYTQNTARLLGRTTASSGAIEEMTVGSGLSLSAGSLTATGGSGLTPGQVISYPTTFTGDTIDGSSTTPFVDVAAFDTKEVLNSRVLHLQTKGASKDQKVRVTLGTTKAGAFDVRAAVAFKGLPWSTADNNTYAEVRLTTAAGAAQIAVCRLQGWPLDSIAGTTIYPPSVVAKFGGSTVSGITDNFTPIAQFGETMTVRFVRDGSNVISYSCGIGTVPLAPAQIIIRSNFEPYTQTVSGTLECIEFLIHTPSGPGAAVEYDLWVDYLQSV